MYDSSSHRSQAFTPVHTPVPDLAAPRTPHAPPDAVGVADSNTEESHYVTEKKLAALA